MCRVEFSDLAPEVKRNDRRSWSLGAVKFHQACWCHCEQNGPVGLDVAHTSE